MNDFVCELPSPKKTFSARRTALGMDEWARGLHSSGVSLDLV